MKLQTAAIVTARQAPYVAENQAIIYDRVDAAERASFDILEFTIAKTQQFSYNQGIKKTIHVSNTLA